LQDQVQEQIEEIQYVIGWFRGFCILMSVLSFE